MTMLRKKQKEATGKDRIGIAPVTTEFLSTNLESIL